jgi:hypothetical protein
VNSLPHPDDSRQDTTQDDHDLDTFFKWERASRDTIDVKKIYIDMAGDLVAGIVLSQLIYWHLPDERGRVRLRVQKGGKKWLAKARHEWWTECRVSPKQVDRALKILAGKGLIEVTTHRFNGAPTKHIRIISNTFIKAWNEQHSTPTKNPFSPNGENPILPKGEIQLPETVKSVTETTAETTAEKKELLAPANADAPRAALAEVDSAIYGTPEKPKHERKRDELFDAVAGHVFGIQNPDALDGQGGRVAVISNWLRGKQPTKNAQMRGVGQLERPATAEELQKFCRWYQGKYRNVSIPKDVGKFAEHFLAYRGSSTPAKVIGGTLDMSDVSPNDPNFYKIQTERMQALWEAQNERRMAS